MHVACESSAWFIFNLNTEFYYLQVIYYNIYMLGSSWSNPPTTPSYSLFTYLENWLHCSWCKYASPLAPGLLTTAHPLLVLPSFHTPQIKLQYLHRRHQQHRLSSSGTSWSTDQCIFFMFKMLAYWKSFSY
jgi:hypothetical protein